MIFSLYPQTEDTLCTSVEGMRGLACAHDGFDEVCAMPDDEGKKVEVRMENGEGANRLKRANKDMRSARERFEERVVVEL